jgi:hypothetical protein
MLTPLLPNESMLWSVNRRQDPTPIHSSTPDLTILRLRARYTSFFAKSKCSVAMVADGRDATSLHRRPPLYGRIGAGRRRRRAVSRSLGIEQPADHPLANHPNRRTIRRDWLFDAKLRHGEHHQALQPQHGGALILSPARAHGSGPGRPDLRQSNSVANPPPLR